MGHCKSSRRFASTPPPSAVTAFSVGDMKYEADTMAQRDVTRVPGHPSGFGRWAAPLLDTPEHRAHIRWLMQKDQLRQDVLLIGENMGELRRLAMEWMRLSNREVEHVLLSQDTGHEDLRQRKELSQNSSIHVDQAAVRAATNGRVLLLEGMERTERNILPLLNNLLENRELNLDDGRILLPEHRLGSNADAGPTVEAVHPDFRVIGLLHVAKGTAENVVHKLDPPLRSRFQARLVPSVSASSTLAVLRELVKNPSVAETGLMEVLTTTKEVLSSCETDNYRDLLVPPPVIPSTNLWSLAETADKLGLSKEVIGERKGAKRQQGSLPGTSTLLFRTVHRSYPYALIPGEHSFVVEHELQKSGLMPKQKEFQSYFTGKKRAASPTEQTEDASDRLESITSGSGYASRVTALTSHSNGVRATVCFEEGNGEDGKTKRHSVSLSIPVGERFSPLESLSASEITSSDTLLAELMVDHAVGRDICLVGGKGTGKTETVKRFCGLLGYEMEPMLLYRDMTSRDLLLRRTTKPRDDATGGGVQDTSWEWSPLVRAAVTGRVAVLDNIDRLHPTALVTLAALLQDRETPLFDGTRLVSPAKLQQLLKVTGKTAAELRQDHGVIGVHPSFRVVATAHPPVDTAASQASYPPLGPCALEMFNYHYVAPLSVAETSSLLSTQVEGLSPALATKLAKLQQKLRQEKYSHLKMELTTRQLLAICQKSTLYASDTEREMAAVSASVHQACLAPFAPQHSLESLMAVLKRCGISTEESADNATSAVVESEEVLRAIGQSPYRLEGGVERVAPPTLSHLIPSVQFFANPSQERVIRDMSTELALGQHLLLIGNQGVGKNKLVDRMLERLQLPRQYVQLHRDVTVQALTSQNVIKEGGLQVEDSPLLTAVQEGQVLVVDEADKAPREVVCVLKGIIDGNSSLPDGRRIVNGGRSGNGVIAVHPDFRMVVLANRPVWPFQGNDFFAECGDLFSCHAVVNPSLESQVTILQQYGPNVDPKQVRQIAQAFDELRRLAEHGQLAYPYGTRECISVVKHMSRFPQDSVSEALSNVLAMDTYDREAKKYITSVFEKIGITLDASLLYGSDRAVVNSPEYLEARKYQMWVEHENTREAAGPKHGKEDPKNEPHVGGNTWAGGTGGADTAGLGGKGGPYRLDKGHTVHQISDAEKQNVSEEVRQRARKMAEEGLAKRLKEIDMGQQEAAQYEHYLQQVQEEVNQLRLIIQGMERKGKERVWVRNQTAGDLDDTRLAEALSGEATVYKQRTEVDQTHFASQRGDNKKKFHFVLDVSGSMYRFNGSDGRLERMLEVAVTIMESLAGFEEKLQYCITGHSGDGARHMFVPYGTPPKNRQERHKVLAKMVAHSQFCYSGDYTVEASRQAVLDMAKDPSSDAKFVLIFSDANLRRYGISPHRIGQWLTHSRAVNAHIFFIASMANEAKKLQQQLPVGRGHVALNTKDLPAMFKNIFKSDILQ